ncbi:MAG: NAD(+)/NADH kinase [Deltaproteobacteria bacterium]|nr:NAD(+)/NADH kinase [Deltaproteobacteria bacterium]
MSTVGIIANPVSGKDIRRLVAHGSVFDNQEKVRIVRRMLMGLAQVGVRRVVYMPDYYAIVERAGRGCQASVDATAINMHMENSQDDSTRAASLMADGGATCLIVLGGDGTCRAVAKGTTRVPLLPISTGTNNVFPWMVEASIAGLAAGLIATGRVPADEGTYRSSCLEVLFDDVVRDIALVDVAVYRDTFIASRAIWDLEKVSQIFMTRCRPDSIGLSAIGGQLRTILPEQHAGLHLCLGGDHRRVTAAIAPGLFQSVPVKSEVLMQVGEMIAVADSPCVLALDGEREVEVGRGGRVLIRLSESGPQVVDVRRTMDCAQKLGVFVHL